MVHGELQAATATDHRMAFCLLCQIATPIPWFLGHRWSEAAAAELHIAAHLVHALFNIVNTGGIDKFKGNAEYVGMQG